MPRSKTVLALGIRSCYDLPYRRQVKKSDLVQKPLIYILVLSLGKIYGNIVAEIKDISKTSKTGENLLQSQIW